MSNTLRLRLERLKTSAARPWRVARHDRPVRIISNGYYWRPNRCGYTSCACEAGVYTFAEAWSASSHCGPEKVVIYEFIKVLQ